MLSLRNTNDPFLDRIVTCGEKWVLYDNRKRSGQWLDRDEPPKHFPKPMLHQKKIMVTVWWSAIGVIHYNFLGVNETINAERYCNDLAVVHARLSEKKPALVNRCGPILLHDNARPHVARMTVQKLTELGYETLPHPPYSPDLSPTDYHLFKLLSTFFDGKTFRSKQECGCVTLFRSRCRIINLSSLSLVFELSDDGSLECLNPTSFLLKPCNFASAWQRLDVAGTTYTPSEGCVIWRCALPPFGGALCLHLEVRSASIWRCALPPFGGALCLHWEVRSASIGRCALPPLGGALCLHLEVRSASIWRCALPPFGGAF
ncbi:Transposase type 1 [Trinorchestia longiramus]|nr:Transposase type 1 [Trinorchestia longiramus]